jgi:hypothetical protein
MSIFRTLVRYRIMKRNLLMILVASTALYGADAKDATNDAASSFRRLKALVGEWQADTPMGKQRLTYELIAGGTTLIERETSDKMPTMLTVYHLDGDRLILTHYCMAGNQPRMLARPFNAATNELQFKFLDATNLTSPSAGHMRNVTLRFVDDNHLNTAWQFYENGQVKMTEGAQYQRVN